MSDVQANYAYWQRSGDFWVEEYQRRRATNARYGLQEILLATVMDANAPARVLEFGCGVGRHLSYLAQIPGTEVTGLDQSPTMLAGVRHLVGDAATAARVRLVEPTGRLPLADRLFDIVFSAEVLVHVRPEDLDDRLAELVRVCRGSLLHLEPPADYALVAEEHDGCWYHDLVAAYARIGLQARRIGRPVEAQELILVDLDPARPLRVPGDGVLRHMLAVEASLQTGLAGAPAPAPAEAVSSRCSAAAARLARRVATLESTSPEAVEAALAALPEEYRAKVAGRRRELHWLRDRGVLPTEIVRGETVVDWECGDGAFAVAMLLEGAGRVVAVDSWLDEAAVPPPLLLLPGLAIAKLDIAGTGAALAEAGVLADLVFANTVTEHIPDLVGAFTEIRRLLRPGGYFFTNHDNYLQPVGSHDHGFLFYGPDLEIVFQGVRCWEQEEKCAASAEHRARIARDYAWTWTPDLERTRDPSDCQRCFYFRRAQPWAHLLYQAEFRTYFGNETFFTGRRRSALNKVTLFQLRQFIVEAGMSIVAGDRSFVANEPPAALLGAPHFLSREDLRTCTATVLAQAS